MDPHDRHRGKLNPCTPPSFHHGLHVSKSHSTGPRSDSRSPRSPAEAGWIWCHADRSGRSSDSELYTWPALGRWLLGPAQSTRHFVGPPGRVSSRKTVRRKPVHLWAAAALALVFRQGPGGHEMLLETFAYREALALADDLVEQKIYVASDCQEAVNYINRGTGGPNAGLVHEITNHSNSFVSCSFVFERRNFNFEAHNLAKFACNLDIGRHVWLGYPHDPNLVPMTIPLNE